MIQADSPREAKRIKALIEAGSAPPPKPKPKKVAKKSKSPSVKYQREMLATNYTRSKGACRRKDGKYKVAGSKNHG